MPLSLTTCLQPQCRRVFKTLAPIVTFAVLILCAAPSRSQSFGLPLLKSKVTLQRKLPALVQLPGTTVSIAVTGHAGAAELVTDFKSMLSAELLKDDPRLSVLDRAADSSITC